MRHKQISAYLSIRIAQGLTLNFHDKDTINTVALADKALQMYFESTSHDGRSGRTTCPPSLKDRAEKVISWVSSQIGDDAREFDVMERHDFHRIKEFSSKQ